MHGSSTLAGSRAHANAHALTHSRTNIHQALMDKLKSEWLQSGELQDGRRDVMDMLPHENNVVSMVLTNMSESAQPVCMSMLVCMLDPLHCAAGAGAPEGVANTARFFFDTLETSQQTQVRLLGAYVSVCVVADKSSGRA